MKFLLLPLLLAAGWFGVNASVPDDPRSCTAEDCRIEVECTDRDTCLVTCYDENDEIVCQKEVPCDAVCDKACDQPCEAPGAAAAGSACPPEACKPASCKPASCAR